MDNLILEFLEAYKSLDELCRQILSSDRGVSSYIDEMDNEKRGAMRVECWTKDYKQLKHMRWIRNKLVHEIHSFQEDLVKNEDIKWLLAFRSRIMKSNDPLSLLYQSKRAAKKTGEQKKSGSHYNRNLVAGVAIFLGICLLLFVFLGICLLLFAFLGIIY